MTVAANALCTLANAKLYMGIPDATTTYDSVIEMLIDAASDVIEAYLGYTVVSAAYVSVLDIIDYTVILPHPNVTIVSAVAFETESALRVKYVGTDTHARVSVNDTAVITTSRVGGTTTTTTTTFAAQATTDAMATTIDALSGWDATLVNSGPSAYLVRGVAQDAKGVEVTLEAWIDADVDYDVDYDAGTVRFLPAQGWHPTWNRARLEYTAGITVPDDIEQACIELVQRTYGRRGQSEPFQAESLGDYSYSRGAMAHTADEDDWWKARIARHRRFRP